MSEPLQALETVAVLRDLGGLCLSLYLRSTPHGALFQRACQAAHERAAALPRHFLKPGTTELRASVPEDDKALFLRSAQECITLALMAQGVAGRLKA